jgi:hypothetical protein
MMWPAARPAVLASPHIKNIYRSIRWYGKPRAKRLYESGPFENPVARQGDERSAIAVYPEIVDGDPLGCGRVVRWLLHRPGHHTGRIEYGRNDLFFYYQEAFDDPAYNRDRDARLTLTWFNDDYLQTNDGVREGSAYLIRKGKGRALTHHPPDAICIDDLTHRERAAVFNRVRTFYSYDLYSMYGLYAARCGCIPIVVPDPALPREVWTPNPVDRYGIAYGEEDVSWAVETRPLLMDHLQAVREEQDAMVRAFAAKCHAAFG